MGLHDAADPVRTEGPCDPPTHCSCPPLNLTRILLPVSITLCLPCDCLCLRTSTSILFIAFFLLVLVGLRYYVEVINDNNVRVIKSNKVGALRFYKSDVRTGSKRVVLTFLIPSALSNFKTAFSEDFFPNMAEYHTTLTKD